jgi:hypothetical protein
MNFNNVIVIQLQSLKETRQISLQRFHNDINSVADPDPEGPQVILKDSGSITYKFAIRIRNRNKKTLYSY